MARILYSAKTPSGKSTSGYLQADSNQAAHQILTNKGYTDIQFYQSGEYQDRNSFASLDKMDPQEIQKLSKQAIRNQTRSHLARKRIQLVKLLEVPLTIGILLIVFGYLGSNHRLMLAGVIAIPLLYIVLYLSRPNAAKLQGQFSQMTDLISYGHFQQAEKMANELLSNKYSSARKSLETELITRKAYLIARQQTLDKGLAYLESMKDRFQGVPDWRYDNTRGRVYIAVGDFVNYLKLLRKAHTKAPDNQIMTLDLVAAEARWGELDTARQLLGSVNMTLLPQFAIAFVDLAKGLIASKAHDSAAVEHFSKAYESQKQYKNNANHRQVLAMMAGHYGLALLDTGNATLAKKIVQEYWDVLKHSTDDALLQALKAGLPVLNNN